MIDITITATIRPEILQRTLKSFWENMFEGKPDVRIIINIDNIGTRGFTQFDCLSVVSQFTSNYKTNMPLSPSFPKAFKWCWEQVNADWVFHLEDDWALNRPVVLDEMIAKMEEDEGLVDLRLSMFRSTNENCKNWNLFYPWDEEGGYFRCPDEYKSVGAFAGHPSLLRGDWVRKAVGCLNDRDNPEKLLSHTPELVDGYKFGVWIGQNQLPLIQDIGRDWRKKEGIGKQGKAAVFTKWEKDGGKEGEKEEGGKRNLRLVTMRR